MEGNDGRSSLRFVGVRVRAQLEAIELCVVEQRMNQESEQVMLVVGVVRKTR